MSTPGPLTCEYCKHAEATCLLVADLSTGRVKALTCEPCATRNLAYAQGITKGNSAAWLFELAVFSGHLPAGVMPQPRDGEIFPSDPSPAPALDSWDF